MDNPNEYNETAWLKASMMLISYVERRVTDAWEAGAQPDNIVEDINAALELAEVPFQVQLVQ